MFPLGKRKKIESQRRQRNVRWFPVCRLCTAIHALHVRLRQSPGGTANDRRLGDRSHFTRVTQPRLRHGFGGQKGIFAPLRRTCQFFSVVSHYRDNGTVDPVLRNRMKYSLGRCEPPCCSDVARSKRSWLSWDGIYVTCTRGAVVFHVGRSGTFPNRRTRRRQNASIIMVIITHNSCSRSTFTSENIRRV